VLTGQSVRVVLPKLSQALTLYVDRVEELVPGVLTYSGEASEIPGTFFTFSVANGRLLGKLLIGLASYVIEPAPNETGKHDLIVLDRGLLPPDDNTLNSPSLDESSSSGSPTTQASTSGTTGSGIVQVLFLFASNVTDQNNRAANIVSEFNAALARSAVDSAKRITSGGLITVQDDFNGLCRSVIINKMRLRNPPFELIDDWLSSEMDMADAAFLIVTTDNNIDCSSQPPPLGQGDGVPGGRIGGLAHLFDPNNPFGLSTDTFALGDLTALHEFGHVLGGQHADESSDIVTTVDFGDGAHGFENNNAGQWQTIMGGYTTPRCVFNFNNPDPVSQTCERINFFSNPVIKTTVNGQLVTIGTNDDDGGVNFDNGQRKADMESWLEESSLPIVSGYQTDPPPPAGAPTLNVMSEHCFGLHTASWNQVTGADLLQLFSSTSSNFTSPVLRFEGTGTLVTINVPQNTTWFLRVRACNGGGCTGLSNQQSATWVNECF